MKKKKRIDKGKRKSKALIQSMQDEQDKKVWERKRANNQSRDVLPDWKSSNLCGKKEERQGNLNSGDIFPSWQTENTYFWTVSWQTMNTYSWTESSQIVNTYSSVCTSAYHTTTVHNSHSSNTTHDVLVDLLCERSAGSTVSACEQ